MFLFVLIVGLVIGEKFVMPVRGAGKKDYNQKSYWAYPWGKSVTHKGVDIFASRNSEVLSATQGVVISAGHIRAGGNYVLILGPRWKFYYYAHLAERKAARGQVVKSGQLIGLVGDTGNAKGKSPHLHFTIFSLLPRIWRMDKSPQGWKKAFFLDPVPVLNSTTY